MVRADGRDHELKIEIRSELWLRRASRALRLIERQSLWGLIPVGAGGRALRPVRLLAPGD
jgi:hypothetical protein